jgi:sugar phosphate isomerase/epimerase
MATFHLGVVSNCWSAQLPETGLAAQCDAALARGHEYVELRQRALAECEETVPGGDRPWPIPDRLRELAERLPGLGFNLAVELPFLKEEIEPSPYLKRLGDAAIALAGDRRPILRFVDLSPFSETPDEERIRALGLSVAGLTRSLCDRGIRTVLENSKLPVATLLQVMSEAGRELGDETPHPLLCWDAANQVQQTFLAEDPVDTARSTAVSTFFEFHFKQLEGVRLLPGVHDGDLDWRAILAAFDAGGYEGPALFEIPPGPDVWERIDAGMDYVKGILAEIEAPGAGA